MDLERIPECVQEALREHPDAKAIAMPDLMTWTVDVARKRGYYAQGHTDDDFMRYWKRNGETAVRFSESVWDLIRQGVLYPTCDLNARGWHPEELCLSQYGREALGPEGPSPYDPDGYLAALNDGLPHLDDMLREYVGEGLAAFRQGCFRASIVMVGCAAERLGDLLADALAAYSQAPVGPALANLQRELSGEGRPHYRRQMKLVDEALEEMPKLVPQDAREAFSDVRHIAEIIRRSRNDYGHPRNVTADPFTAKNDLAMFLPLCCGVYKVLDWLSHPSS